MTNIFEVLEIICLFLNIASLVVIGIGWLTCADYYYKLASLGDGLSIFMYIVFTVAVSVASVVNGLSFDGIGTAPYLNFVYWLIVIFIVTSVFVCNKIMVLHQYFAHKRGRV